MNLPSENCKAQTKAATEACGDLARARRLTPGERALLALIGEIVAERLWADAMCGSAAAATPAEQAQAQTDGRSAGPRSQARTHGQAAGASAARGFALASPKATNLRTEGQYIAGTGAHG